MLSVLHSTVLAQLVNVTYPLALASSVANPMRLIFVSGQNLPPPHPLVTQFLASASTKEKYQADCGTSVKVAGTDVYSEGLKKALASMVAAAARMM